MIDDVQIIEAATRAERIKAAVPTIQVSADAIFTAIVLGKRQPGRPRATHKPPVEPPEWFAQGLQEFKGRSMTIGQFLVQSGRFPVAKPEANAVGRWLRASGRTPRKSGGQLLFDI